MSGDVQLRLAAELYTELGLDPIQREAAEQAVRPVKRAEYGRAVR